MFLLYAYITLILPYEEYYYLELFQILTTFIDSDIDNKIWSAMLHINSLPYSIANFHLR